MGRAYPAPLVDLAKAAKAAREKVWAVRSGDAFRVEAADIVTRHASRKDRGAGRHFVNDRANDRVNGRARAPRKAPRDNGQLSLDL